MISAPIEEASGSTPKWLDWNGRLSKSPHGATRTCHIVSLPSARILAKAAAFLRDAVRPAMTDVNYSEITVLPKLSGPQAWA